MSLPDKYISKEKAAKNRAEVIDQNCFGQALDQLPKKKEQRKIGF